MFHAKGVFSALMGAAAAWAFLGAALPGAGAAVVTINFVALPGPDGVPGTADDVAYTAADYTNTGGSRDMDSEYAATGLHISGTNGTPRLSVIGGGLDPDGALGTPSNNAVLRGASAAGLTPIVLMFDHAQTSIRVDLAGALGFSGNTAPVVLKRAGVTVASYTLSSTNAMIYNGNATQLSGRWVVQTSAGGGSGTFDQVTFALTGPSNGGLFLDNLTFEPVCRADFNGSGVISVQDIFDFLAAYFAHDPRADFNGSAVISVQDIFDFLAAWFAGCA